MYPTEQEAIEHTAALAESRDDALSLIADLRAQLDDAHQHIGALGKTLTDVEAWIVDGMPADQADPFIVRIRAILAPARAWLRREAK